MLQSSKMITALSTGMSAHIRELQGAVNKIFSSLLDGISVMSFKWGFMLCMDKRNT